MPEKFWDEADGAVRLDALLKSYVELERKLGAGDATEGVEPVGNDRRVPCGAGRDRDGTGSVEIASPHPLIEPDAELNDRLRAAGFSQARRSLSTSSRPSGCCR